MPGKLFRGQAGEVAVWVAWGRFPARTFPVVAMSTTRARIACVCANGDDSLEVTFEHDTIDAAAETCRRMLADGAAVVESTARVVWPAKVYRGRP